MDKWDYLTTFITADSDNDDARSYLDMMGQADAPPYTPAAMMPELNRLGAKGWELVHMEPVTVGRNHDVLTHDATARQWTNQYFCVFKRKDG